MKILAVLFVIFFGMESAHPGYLQEYQDLNREFERNQRRFREIQAKISNLNTTWNHFWSPRSTRREIDRLFRQYDQVGEDQRRTLERMEYLRERQMVRVWGIVNGQLNSRLERLGTYIDCNCNVEERGEEIFLTSNAKSSLDDQRSATKQVAAYITRRDPYLSRCLSEPIRLNSTVNTRSRTICKNPNTYHGSSVNYKLEWDGTVITLKASFNMSFVGESSNRAEAHRRIGVARACIEDFYSRHGINLVLTLDVSSRTDDHFHDSSITLHDTYARANASHWATHHTVGRDMDDESFCALAIHEFGHKLGLPDTYPDPDCPDRPLILPYPNVMSNSHYSPDDLELNDDQLRSILAPLCGP